jgi:hypothetical protein
MRIKTRDKGIVNDLLEVDLVQSANMEKEVADGVAIQYRGQVIREALGLPELFRFSIFVAEHIALPIAVGLLSRYLYDKLKNKKQTEIIINYVTVEINAEKIEQLILAASKEEKTNGMNNCRLRALITFPLLPSSEGYNLP